MGFEVARELLRVGGKSGLLIWAGFASRVELGMGSTGSLVNHLKHIPDSQGQFTITLGNYAKRNTR